MAPLSRPVQGGMTPHYSASPCCVKGTNTADIVTEPHSHLCKRDSRLCLAQCEKEKKKNGEKVKARKTTEEREQSVETEAERETRQWILERGVKKSRRRGYHCCSSAETEGDRKEREWERVC